MTDEIRADADAHDLPEKPVYEESTGDEELDKLLSEPILKGDKGIDVAQVWMSAFMVAMAGVIAYSTVFAVPFIGGMSDAIRDTAAVHSFTTAWNAAAVLGVSHLTALTFGLNWVLTPNSAAGFTAVNAIIHILNGILVYLVVRRLLRGQTHEAIAMLGGLLFVLHPLATEAINAILPRGILLATFFSLLSLLLYLRSVGTEDQPSRPGSLILSLVSFVIACACAKEAWILPVVVFAMDSVVFGKARGTSRVYPLSAYWVVLIALGVAWKALGHSFLDDFFALHASPATHGIQLVMLALAPYQQALIQPHIASYPGASEMTLWVAMLALALTAYMGRLTFTLFWVFSGAAVAATLHTLPDGVHESWAYFSLVGVAFLLPWLLQALPKIAPVRVVAGLAAVALLGTAGVATFQRNQLWQDPVALWSDTLAKNPDYAVAHEQVGLMLLAEARPAAETVANQPNIDYAKDARLEPLREVEARLLKAVAKGVPASRTLAALATTQRLLGKTDEALASAQRALLVDNLNQNAALELARMYRSRARAQGNTDEMFRAVEYFRYASHVSALPDDAAALYALSLMDIGDYESAQPLLKQAVGNQEKSPYAPILQNVTKRNEQTAALEKQVRELQKQTPTPDGMRTLAQLLLMRGRYLQANYMLQDLLGADPSDRASWVLLGYARARMGQEKGFAQEMATSPAATSPESWTLLARQCAAEGLWRQARLYIECPAAASAGITAPLVMLGDMATEFRQPALALDLYRNATEAQPQSPAPWLKLCDIALAAKDLNKAREYFTEAERRAASPEELDRRRAQLGDFSPAPSPSGRVLLQ